MNCTAASYAASNCSADTANCSTASRYYVTGTQALAIGFSHDYRVQPPRGLEQAGDSRTRSDDILSVVLQHDAELPAVDSAEYEDAPGVLAVFRPGDAIRLSLGTRLHAAGVGLDSVNRAARPSEPPGTGLPLTRLTGAELIVHITYTNDQAREGLPSYRDVPGHDGVLAVIQVEAVPGWTSRTEVDIVDAAKSSRFRYMYGLGVRAGHASQPWSVSGMLIANS